MQPSGTTTGTELEVSCPAALRLPVLGGEPAGRNVGRIRHVCRHPALPQVWSLTARRRCACAGLGGSPQEGT
ncbi:hypothetical protein D0900_23280 [Klebsiella pneumoniae]|nr:hypothetical protein D0900_23280 [Klebsiella pneumoniae]